MTHSPTPPKRKSDLKVRALSAIALAPPVLAAVWWGGMPFQLLVLVLAALSVWEFVRLTAPGSSWLSFPNAGFMVLGPLLILMIDHDHWLAFAVLIFLGVCSSIVMPWWRPRLRIRSNGFFALTSLYLGLPFLSMLWLRLESGPYGLALFLFLMLSIWATDIGAYAAGRTIGGPKLAPRISPKKTWAGLIGGMASAALLGGLFGAAQSGDWLPGWLVPPAATDVPHHVTIAAIAVYAAIGAVLAVAGQAGDLFESYMKRRVDVKDSSNLIPGHGGILDRIDGLLFAAPLYALFELTAGEWVRFW
ncbi:phosphatidate cytidylyltransferase [Niveispirillum sp. KHB5.9]|uniref:phosphatidate cytidylyltransferase n=1 Tax=Niveispirillum sp. KHB5.9 TaxID=3400269 RepID=UPI003A86FDC4